jgi:hypothetical protein
MDLSVFRGLSHRALTQINGPGREDLRKRGVSRGESSVMSIVVSIVLGLVAGFIASKIVNKTGEGVLLDTLLGIVGANVGGFLLIYHAVVRRRIA